MFPILVGLGSIAGLFCLWVYRTGDRCIDRRLCYIRHRVGPITLRHYEAISCERAVEVAEMAQRIWQRLELVFPGQSGKFTLFVIFDPSRGPGHRRGRKVVINLADQDDQDDDDDLLDTLAEELHHLLYGLWAAQAGVKVKYVFKPEKFMEHEDVVRYYAENPHEYRALCFAVALVGKRAKLLEEVEKYRALHSVT